MTPLQENTCPGCGLQIPAGRSPPYHGYYHTSPECWAVYTEVLGSEFGNAVLFGQVHQLTVDTYAVQHAGGGHPDKSIDVHLVGLHLMLERDMRPTSVPKYLQRLADVVTDWPHFPTPDVMGAPTVCDVALSDSVGDHIDAVQAWAGSLWEAWSRHHAGVADFVTRHLKLQ